MLDARDEVNLFYEYASPIPASSERSFLLERP